MNPRAENFNEFLIFYELQFKASPLKRENEN